jgi:hypothetical protein
LTAKPIERLLDPLLLTYIFDRAFVIDDLALAVADSPGACQGPHELTILSAEAELSWGVLQELHIWRAGDQLLRRIVPEHARQRLVGQEELSVWGRLEYLGRAFEVFSELPFGFGEFSLYRHQF